MATILLGLTLAAVRDEGPSRRPVVLVTDCGASFDDEWALAHLATSPAFDLLGVIATHAPNLGPSPAEASARAARAWLDRLPLATRPRVVAGANRPLGGVARADPGAVRPDRAPRGYAPNGASTWW